MTLLQPGLLFSTMLFMLSLLGIFMNQKNVILLLMCIEMMLLSVNTNFILFSQLWQNVDGQIMVFFILTLAAAEAAIGLGIVLVYFRSRQTLEVAALNRLKG